MSALTGTATFDRFFASHRPWTGSWSLSSMVALPQPQMIPPVIWAPGGPRVDDATRGVHADRAPQPQQPEVGVHADLDEDGTPGPHRVRGALAVTVHLRVAGQGERAVADELVDSRALHGVRGSVSRPRSDSCLATSRAAAATALPVPMVVDEP